MFRYIARRLLWMIPIVLCVTIFIFTLMYFVPGDVARIQLGSAATEVEIQALREAMGLNDSYIVRLFRYLSDVFLHFDFGVSLTDKVSITHTLVERFPRTFIISICATLFGALLGTPLGIVAGTHPHSIRDRISMLVSLVGISMPRFWLALLLVICFSVNLKWLPSQGLGGFEYYILPCASAGFMTLAMQARHTRSSMLEQMRADYIVTAMAKGASRRRVIYRHALPNASIPVITQLFSGLGSMMAGNLIIEQIFGIPGVGSYLIRAVNNRDYTAVQGSVIFLAIVLSIVVLVTDIVYAAVDPRIKAQFVGKGATRRKFAGKRT